MAEAIPTALRIAVKNAVGGWGPYSVRGIHDLFNSYGFADSDPTVEDTGERRTAADRYQARIDWSSPIQVRRYLDLVAEVLAHYPEDSAAPPSGEGPRLRRVLAQLGIRADDAGRLSLQVPQGEQPVSSTEGIWYPGRPRLFVSHLSSERAVVGAFAAQLNAFGFSPFVAHDAIEPSRAWQETIRIALATMDVLVAYVTPGFHDSLWTDQEVGCALGRPVPVVPLDAGAKPYGFFGAYQAAPLARGQAATLAAEVVTRAVALAVFRHQCSVARALEEGIARVLVSTFVSSVTFETTRRRFALLELVPRDLWSAPLRAALEQAAADNRQIRECVLDDRRAATDAIRQLTG